MLEAISIENFRCITQARLEFDPRATIVVGNNGSGKSSLLEAIYFVGSGRSFRTQVRQHLVARSTDVMRVVARCRNDLGEIALGAEFQHGATRFRRAGLTIKSAAEIAEVLPLQAIDPGVHRLIEEGSMRRRRLLDWGVFHVKHEFMPAWRRYHRALEQRNAALRAGAALQLVMAWDQELALAGTTVDEARRSYFKLLVAHFDNLARELLTQPAQLRFHSGWPDGATLEQAIVAAHPRDVRVRHTSVGPHRCDLRVTYAGEVAREQVSRGEQKMLAVTLILAQVRCLAATVGRQTCLLIDDPAAELDVDNLGKLLACVDRLPGQLIITAVQRDALNSLSFGRMFHVKQGRFEPVL